MTIERMRLEDIAHVHALGTNIDEFKVDDSQAVFWDVETLRELVLSDTDIALISRNNDVVTGFSIMTYHPPTRKATFENLYVSPDYRGSGLAKQLAEASVSRAIVFGAKYICGMVEQENNASVKLLQKAGFEKGKEYVWMSRYI